MNEETARQVAVAVLSTCIATLLGGWLLMLALGAVTEWDLSFWQCAFIASVGVLVDTIVRHLLWLRWARGSR